MTTTLEERFATLRRMLTEEAELPDIVSYFFTELSGRLTRGAGDATYENPVLDEALEGVVADLAPDCRGPLEITLLRVGEHRFVHGVVMLRERLGTVLYFEDMQHGVVALTSPDGLTDFAGFAVFAPLADNHDAVGSTPAPSRSR